MKPIFPLAMILVWVGLSAFSGCQPGAATAAPVEAQKAEPAAPAVFREPPKADRKWRDVPERYFQLDDLERVKIKIDKHEFDAWVMDTNDKRQEGMMFLKNSDFKDTDCMIFVFESAQPRGFWMHNTLVDLDIAYLDLNKKILNIETMKALDESNVPSKGAAKYAIEFRAKLLNKLKIKPGMKVTIPDSVKAKKEGDEGAKS